MTQRAAGRIFTVSRSIDIDASAGRLYAMVSDVARMGEWSPENRGSTLLGNDQVVPGARFEGRNRRGRATWVTRCTVTAAEPGSRFAFRVHRIGVSRPRIEGPNASWEYRFEPLSGGGTRVTETWTDDRRSWPDPLARIFDAVVTGGDTFANFQRKNIDRTLANLKRVAETT